MYTTLIGLIAATGLRVSEALDLRFSDVLPDGVLQIRRTKFGKSRLVPLHPTAATALSRYLEVRRQLAVTDDHLSLSAGNRRIGSSMVEYTFRRIRHLAGIAPARTRPPRIHDLRHTVATRALEQCPTGRAAVARHFVALATYLGHSDIKYTYWYLEATPELMTGLATAAEALFGRGEGMTPIAPLITASCASICRWSVATAPTPARLMPTPFDSCSCSPANASGSNPLSSVWNRSMRL